MDTVKVVLDRPLSTPPDCHNANDIVTIAQVIAKSATELGPQYHHNLKTHIAAALNRDRDTLIVNVYQNDIHDVVSVRLVEVVNKRLLNHSKGDLTVTCHRVSACFFFNVHHHNIGDTLDAVVW